MLQGQSCSHSTVQGKEFGGGGSPPLPAGPRLVSRGLQAGPGPPASSGPQGGTGRKRSHPSSGTHSSPPPPAGHCLPACAHTQPGESAAAGWGCCRLTPYERAHPHFLRRGPGETWAVGKHGVSSSLLSAGTGLPRQAGPCANLSGWGLPSRWEGDSEGPWPQDGPGSPCPAPTMRQACPVSWVQPTHGPVRRPCFARVVLGRSLGLARLWLLLDSRPTHPFLLGSSPKI